MESAHRIFKICLTGGACSGKTTSLFTISEALIVRGYKVLIIPEAATMLMKGGIQIDSETFTEEMGLDFQANLLQTQIHLEDTFERIGRSFYKETDIVILCDRGLMDGSAYVSKDSWKKVVSRVGLTKEELNEKRYDGVIHLVTAAQGAEEFYNKENEARYENIEQAREKDLRLRKAYVNHPQHFIIYNMTSKGFDEKVNNCLDAVYSIIGLESNTIFFKKYLVKKCEDISKIDQSYQIPIDVSHLKGFKTLEVYEDFIHYKVGDGEVLFSSIVKKFNKNTVSYSLHLTVAQHNQIQHKKKGIQIGDYNAYLALKDTRFRQLKKKRIFLMHNSVSYKVDYYPELEGQPVILVTWISNHSNTEEKKQIIEKETREIFDIDQDITDNDAYFGMNLAKLEGFTLSKRERSSSFLHDMSPGKGEAK